MVADPFAHLPLEIFTTIVFHSFYHFEFAGPRHYGGSHVHYATVHWTPLRLTLVCKTWKEVIMTSPNLWTEWCLAVSHASVDSEIMLRKIDALATLSGATLVAIQLIFDHSLDCWKETPYNDVNEALRPHASRIQILRLKGPERGFRTLSHFNMPCLRTLEVINAHCRADVPAMLLEPIKFDAPNLTNLLLCEVTFINVDFPKRNLRHLILSALSPSECMTILERTPDIEYLGVYFSRLGSIYNNSAIHNIPVTLKLPRLRVLDWAWQISPLVQPSTFFSVLNTPRLEHLRWCYSYQFSRTRVDPPVPSRVVADYALKWTATLKSIIFQVPVEMEDILLEVWASSSTLTVAWCRPEKPQSSENDELGPYVWRPEGWSTRTDSHVLQDSEWGHLAKYILPPVSESF